MMKRVFISLIFIIFIALMACTSQLVLEFEDLPYYSYEQINVTASKVLEFALILPENLVDGRAYPVVIIFPPGDQSKDMVISTILEYWIRSSIKRNWIVVSPITFGTERFWSGAEQYIPQLYTWIEDNYLVEGNKYHLAGESAGGTSAFRVAIQDTSKCHTVISLTGGPINADMNRIGRLRFTPVSMYVGDRDLVPLEIMQATKDSLDSYGGEVSLKIYPNEDHYLDDLESEELFDWLDSHRNL